MPDQTVTVLRAKGVLDVDLGEVLEGASVVIEGNRITAVTDDPPAASEVDQVIDLPDLTLVPGLMDMEVDLVLGGPGAGLSDPGADGPGEDGPASGRQRPADPAGRLHDGAQPRPVHQDRRLPRRRRPRRRHRRRLGRGTPGHPRRPRHLPDRRPPRPERAERPGPGHHADDRRGGHRRRDRRGPQGRPLPDHARRQAHQVLRVGRRDDPHRPAGRAAVLHRGAHRDRRRGPPSRPAGRHPLPTATRPSTPPSTPASTASSTG